MQIIPPAPDGLEVRFLRAANLRAASDHLVPNFQHGMDPDFVTQFRTVQGALNPTVAKSGQLPQPIPF